MVGMDVRRVLQVWRQEMLMESKLLDPFICPACYEVRDQSDADEAACVSCGVCAVCSPTAGGCGSSELCVECQQENNDD